MLEKVILKQKCKNCNGSGYDHYAEGKCYNCDDENGNEEIEIDLNKWLEDKLKELRVIK